MNRILLAWKVLRGQVILGGDVALHCNRRHVGGGETVIKDDVLKEYQEAADDLKLARGVIAGSGKTKDYHEMQESTIGK